MIGILILAASPLPLPANEFTKVEVTKAIMPRFVFMCRSAGDHIGAIVDVRNDSTANYLSIRRTGQPKLESRAPIAKAAHRIAPGSYAMQLGTDALPDGSAVTLQVQSVNSGPLTAWFDWAGAEPLTGSCRSIPAPPAGGKERGQ